MTYVIAWILVAAVLLAFGLWWAALALMAIPPVLVCGFIALALVVSDQPEPAE